LNLRLSLAGAQAFLKGGPWIAPQDQLSFRVPPAAGTILRVQDANGDFLGWCVSDGVQLSPAFRVLSRERHAEFGAAWAGAQVELALGKRRGLALPGGPQRLIHGEADGLPGLSVDVCDGVALASYASPGLAHYSDLLESALIQQARLKGLWVRFATGEAWTAWTRSPHLPLSPASFRVQEAGLAVAVDLEKEAQGPGLPWPVDQRRWRLWAQAQAPGKRVLILGGLDGPAQAAATVQPAELSVAKGSLFKALEKAAVFKPQVVLADVPAESKESFGKFDTEKHLPRLLKDLAEAAAPGASLLLASGAKALWHALPWEQAWKEARPEGVPALETVLGPEPDFPDLALWPQGRARKAFVFKLGN
jgi:23S rRNA (cytosine1962-C5)-methyltransferase